MTCAIGLTIDLVTKVWAFGRLAESVVWDETGRVHVFARDAIQFIPGWLHFEAVANQGAVFGIGQGQRWLFLIVSAGAIGLLTYLFLQSGRARFYQIVLGMLLAGVLGNMYDRMVHGFVRDMFHVFPDMQWPAFVQNALSFIPYFRGPIFPWIFNVADSFLCVGVAISIVYSFRAQGTDATEPGDDRTQDAKVADAKPQA
ncbi:MAG TPA: signal peptidase II [Tepidisphaeraceae bacterium]|nr:signal peptidase II [Tepidisphaeraceae bacterium]